MEELKMGKHGKRVSIDKKLNLDSSVDVFSNPELLDAYLDSLGVGHTPSPATSNTERREIEDNLFSGNSQEEEYDDCEDAGAAIAEMLMQKMGGSPRPKYKEHAKMPEKIQTATLYGVTNTTVETKTTVVETPVVEDSDTKLPTSSTKKPHSNICLTRYVNGVKHISMRDFAGNATSTVVRSGEMYIKPEDVDVCLRELYIFRKLTGYPAAVYEEKEFANRMLSNNIHDVSDRYMFMKSENFEDLILAFVFDEDEMDQFVNYVKASLTIEEIPDTVLAIVTAMSNTSILTGDLGVAEWHLATYAGEDSLKESLENDILEHVPQDENVHRVEIDFDDYDAEINATIATIGNCVENLKDVKRREEEEIMPGKTQDDFERFDPYKNQLPSTEEGKDTGASGDVKTFPDGNNESKSGAVSENDNDKGSKLHNVRESGEGTNPNVQQAAQNGESKEEKEETGVRIDGGNRGTSELEETKKEEAQTGNGHPEIAEVDPESFKFEEEKEEKHSMVIDRIVCGAK